MEVKKKLFFLLLYSGSTSTHTFIKIFRFFLTFHLGIIMIYSVILGVTEITYYSINDYSFCVGLRLGIRFVRNKYRVVKEDPYFPVQLRFDLRSITLELQKYAHKSNSAYIWTNKNYFKWGVVSGVR